MSVFIFSKPGNLFMISFLLCACVNDRDFSRPEKLSSPPSSAPGFPSRAADLDVWPGFQSPPAGYGEVPFWWWSGDPLDKDRLLWQIEELHKKGITGLQVNYIHQDTPGWPTYPAEPEIFSDEWWDMWTFAADECRKRNMGLGLSGYTLDWPKGDNLFNRIVYNNPEIRGREIQKRNGSPRFGFNSGFASGVDGRHRRMGLPGCRWSFKAGRDGLVGTCPGSSTELDPSRRDLGNMGFYRRPQARDVESHPSACRKNRGR